MKHLITRIKETFNKEFEEATEYLSHLMKQNTQNAKKRHKTVSAAEQIKNNRATVRRREKLEKLSKWSDRPQESAGVEKRFKIIKV